MSINPGTLVPRTIASLHSMVFIGILIESIKLDITLSQACKYVSSTQKFKMYYI